MALIAVGACDRTALTTDSAPSTGAPSEASDGEVTTRVMTALRSDAALQPFDIQVTTAQGDVRITGILDTAGQVDRARTLALGVEGVRSLHDELTVKR